MSQQSVVIVDRNGTEHEFPAGFDPKRAAEIVRGQFGGAQAETPTPEGPSGLQKAAKAFLDYVPNPMGIARGIRGAIRTVTNPSALPTGGAMGGAVTGASLGSTAGPLGTVAGGIIGAGVGGFLGKGGEIMSRESRGEDAPENPLTDMAKRGAGEAALQAGGGVVGKGLQMVGRGAYRFALRPQNTVTKKYGADALIQEGLDQGIVVRKGQKKAGALATSRKAKKDALVDAAGSRVSVSVPRVADDTAQGLWDEAQSMRRAGLGDPTDAFNQQAKGIIDNNPRGVTPASLEALKRTRDDRLGAAFTKRRKREPLTPDEQFGAQFVKTAGDTLETVVPGYRDMNRGIMTATGLDQAIRTRTGTSAGNNGLENLAAIFMGPAAIPARVAAMPPVASALGIGANRTGKATEKGFAQAVRAAILARLAGQQE